MMSECAIVQRGTLIGRVGAWLRGSRRTATQGASSLVGVAHDSERGGAHDAARALTQSSTADSTQRSNSEMAISELAADRAPRPSAATASGGSTPPPDDQAHNQAHNQAQWLERSTKTLDECRELLSCLAEDSRECELLQRMAEQLDGTRAALSQAVDALGTLPGIADSQRASLVCLRTHIESSQAAHHDDLAAMREIKEDIAASREVAVQLKEQMQALHEMQQGCEDRWAVMVDEKTRPLLRMGWSLVILTAASLVLSLIALWR